MSGNSLPDEIISEILCPALRVPDDKFSDTSDISPFTEYIESPSAYLLVCKAWLRVSTPLLYNVVVLRSKAQAKALGRTLSENRDLGQFIKRLRVEGGYGPPMRVILQASTNISELCISLDIVFADNTTGLCHGLPLINPTRLILRDRPGRPSGNRSVCNLMNALVNAIPQWTRLSTLHLPCLLRRTHLLEALVRAKGLRTIVVPDATSALQLYNTTEIKTSRSLRSIQIEAEPNHWQLEVISSKPDLQRLVRWMKEPTAVQSLNGFPHIMPSSNPHFIPMERETEQVQAIVWSRILYFALDVPLMSEDFSRQTKLPGRLPLLLICRSLYTLALPWYYMHAKLTRLDNIVKFVNVLQTNPSLGPQILSIQGQVSRYMYWLFQTPLESDWGPMLLSYTPNLVQFKTTLEWGSDRFRESNAGISREAFAMLAECSGSTLQKLSVQIVHDPWNSEPTSPVLLAYFTNLRSLDLTSLHELVFDLNPEIVPFEGLPRLVDLRVCSRNASLILILSRMRLPSLRTVVFDNVSDEAAQCIISHGTKILELKYPVSDIWSKSIFVVCPRLQVLTLCNFFDTAKTAWSTVADFSSERVLSESLERIVFSGEFENNCEWDPVFTAIKAACFPKLRQIEVESCVWPTKERDIAKDCCVRWAEILKKEDISLTDKNGKKWRSRLQFK
ncbi:hypothetical protein FB45DRAFT_843346 [Roridomyces roridus]|uniref:Uncharacterized protein n=1 Tax=Roridomyces roridus TaxID=1738132 RepID=A0AAD7FAB8_9AGAR|nr:hypothetical protein FB45DRAFT_843346 [Roridomyces roridus]